MIYGTNEKKADMQAKSVVHTQKQWQEQEIGCPACLVKSLYFPCQT